MQGYASTSTRELAAAVGMQSSSLYHHMQSKEDLLEEICIKGNELMLQAVPAAVKPTSTSIDAVEAAIHAHLTTAIENRDVMLTTLADLKSLPPDARRRVDRKRREYGDLLRELLRDAQSDGYLRTDIKAEHLMLVLRNQLAWTLFWYGPNHELSMDQLTDLMFRVFVEGAQNQH